MKKILLLFTLLTITSFTLFQEPKDIVKRADEKSRGKTSFATITVQTIRPNWSREMTVKAWTKGNKSTLILVLSPAKEKGVVFLKKDKEIWNWIPSIERTIKMPPSMMNQSWMGTDFTNDDLVKEASILEDYVHSFLEDVTIDGRECYKIQLIPKPKSAVVWGKIIMCIDKKEYLMLYSEYFDEDGELVNTMKSSEIKLFGDRVLPSKIEMIPANKKGNKTVLIYNSLNFDIPIEDSFFSTQNSTKVK